VTALAPLQPLKKDDELYEENDEAITRLYFPKKKKNKDTEQ